MTNNEFKMWLSGYFELENASTVLSAKQLWIIHNHLRLVLAVSGELDDHNKWLKSRLESLDAAASTTFLNAEFKQITQQMQKWLAAA